MRKESVALKFVLGPLLISLLILASSCNGALSTATTTTTTAKEVTTSPDTPVSETSSATVAEVITSSSTTEEFDIKAYRLTIDGLVESPLSLSYDAILQYPAVTKKVWLICPGFFETNQDWTGVPLTLLLTEASLKVGASRVEFYSSDGYNVELTLNEAQNDGTFIAYGVDGTTLASGDGYPIRLVTSKGGSYWVRWLVHIKVS